MNRVQRLALLWAWAKKSTVKMLAAVALVPFTAGAAYIVSKYVLNPPKPRIVSISTKAFRRPLEVDDRIKNLLRGDRLLARRLEDNFGKVPEAECREGLYTVPASLDQREPLEIRDECTHSILMAAGKVDESIRREIDDLEASTAESKKTHAEIKAAKSQLSHAEAVWRELYRLDHDAESPIRDAEITVSIINEGNADVLISDSAILKKQSLTIPLVANSGAPIPLRSQSTATMVFSTKDLYGDSQQKWLEFLTLSGEKDFDLVLMVGNRQVSAPGSL